MIIYDCSQPLRADRLRQLRTVSFLFAERNGSYIPKKGDKGKAADPACRCRSPVFLTQTAARSGPRLAESISSSRWGRRPLQVRPGGSQTKQPGSAASEAMPRANGVAQKARRPWKRPFLSSTGRGAVFLFGQVPKRKIGGRITQFFADRLEQKLFFPFRPLRGGRLRLSRPISLSSCGKRNGSCTPPCRKCQSRACFNTARQWRGCGNCVPPASATGSGGTQFQRERPLLRVGDTRSDRGSPPGECWHARYAPVFAAAMGYRAQRSEARTGGSTLGRHACSGRRPRRPAVF